MPEFLFRLLSCLVAVQTASSKEFQSLIPATAPRFSNLTSFRGAVEPCFLFMDDNAPSHRTAAVEYFLDSEDVQRMDWPVKSQDLNPIEHLWNFTGRLLPSHDQAPGMITDLKLALQSEWYCMPQQRLDNLILSVDRRCKSCIACRGEHILY